MAANDEEFEEIKQIFLRFQASTHQFVKADDDSWEGVYVRTRGQYYLEFLRNRRSNGIGLCQKVFGLMTQDARHITQDFPNLPWQTFDRSKDGQKWFTALACDNYLDLTTPFNTWVMHYYQMDAKQIVSFPKFEISRICSLQFSANPNVIDKVKLNSAWFNSTKDINEKEARFSFQTYYSDPLELQISFDNSGPGFNFKKAVFKLEPDTKISDIELKHFKFYKKDEFYIFERM